MAGAVEPGTLYVVATPIGNLEDLGARAVRVLQTVDRVACEDTRVARRLMEAVGASKPLMRHDAHTEAAGAAGIVALLEAGERIAYISDAGTPGVSDPGARLVAAAAEAGCGVVPVPGASAVTTALMGSGLPADRFAFHGFLPKKAGPRRAMIEALEPGITHVVFCPARDLRAVTADWEAAWQGREGARVVVARELTKRYEAFVRGAPGEVAARYAGAEPPRGEAAVCARSDTGPARAAASAAPATDAALRAALDEAVEAGARLKDAARDVAARFGVARRRVYQLGLAARDADGAD